MIPKVALATLNETRPDFRARRQHLVDEEIASLDWLRKAVDLYESSVIISSEDVRSFAKNAVNFGAHSLLIHIPVWTEPILTVKLSTLLSLPVILLSNDRLETSSMVGLLGAGGALDQINRQHERIIGHTSLEARQHVLAFARAAAAKTELRGQTMGLFGGRSLGIFTATADPAQWQQIFGVDIEHVDQMVIVETANSLKAEEVEKYFNWLQQEVGKVEYGGIFTPEALKRQIRSYLATKTIIEQRGFDFVGVKCQPELSDGYTNQCLAHLLVNGTIDADGSKKATVHSCEADADGALTMQILHLLSSGKPVALLDIRWFNANEGVWTLANCGAIPATFATSEKVSNGLSGVHIVPHVFGQAGGAAFPMVVTPRTVTMARLCRRAGEYWMAIVLGQTEERGRDELSKTTAEFPQAFVKTKAGKDFIASFGSNHIHMVTGDYTDELVTFCRLIGIPWQLWS